MYFCYTKLDYTRKAVSSVVGRLGQLHMQKSQLCLSLKPYDYLTIRTRDVFVGPFTQKRITR